MFIRAAFFEGNIAAGREAAFDQLIAERLEPLWRRFPGALRVDVMREVAMKLFEGRIFHVIDRTGAFEPAA